jgi:hypothetical protein
VPRTHGEGGRAVGEVMVMVQNGALFESWYTARDQSPGQML